MRVCFLSPTRISDVFQGIDPLSRTGFVRRPSSLQRRLQDNRTGPYQDGLPVCASEREAHKAFESTQLEELSATLPCLLLQISASLMLWEKNS